MIRDATDLVIGMVVSFDQIDNLTWTFWSSGPNTRVVPEGLTAAAFTRYSRTFTPVVTDTQVAADSLGFHAEELFILCWDSLLRVARERQGNPAYIPGVVWLVLSKSSCTGQVASSPLRIGDVLYPHSCCMKFRDFIGGQVLIPKWKIRYYNLAGSKTASSDLSRHNAAVHPDTGLEALRAKKEQIDAEFEVKFRNWRQHIPKKYERAGPNQEGLVRGHLKAERIKAFTANQVAMNALRDRMRSLSVAQAQIGISMLETIVKVDIRRVLTNPVIGNLPAADVYWT
jgi:hypothetical protein